MSKQIFTVVALTAKEGKLEELKEVVSKLAEETRKEAGVIEYLVIENALKPNTVFSIEKWENEKEEEKHWETPHLKSALEKLDDILASEAVIHKGFSF
ncbi:putative quinol monooxygenase [Sediminitomix flava]|uniref:Quinol monooxygenase YgiN n=1 Tax=Sediminitomix flava TaxID=379075 RepID=A0A315ZIM5_SEDFL|nr:antibiotic biosynthesis monooxygenase [Sediminitomix flava]PWJ44950.1 quinol monooxygenase YgiN [Sediminitomix flava]